MDPHPITGAEELVALAVPDDDREQPAEVGQHVGAPAEIGARDALGVAGRWSDALEPPVELRAVVEHAVEHHAARRDVRRRRARSAAADEAQRPVAAGGRDDAVSVAPGAERGDPAGRRAGPDVHSWGGEVSDRHSRR